MLAGEEAGPGHLPGHQEGEAVKVRLHALRMPVWGRGKCPRDGLAGEGEAVGEDAGLPGL
ncbi:hypothetical protein FJNA_13600 [Thermus sp. FJN-A]